MLGEYLSDVQTLRAEGQAGLVTIRKTSPLRRDLRDRFGTDIAERYGLDLLRLVQTKPADKVEAKRPGRRQRNDARYNDRKIRAAMLAHVNEAGRLNRGLRRIAQDAGVSAMSVKRAIDTWQADGQLIRHRWPRGRTSSIELHLEHPAWSEAKRYTSSAA